MHRAGSLLWSGSTLLTWRTISTLNTSHRTQTKTLITKLMPSCRISNDQFRYLCQIGSKVLAPTFVNPRCQATRNSSSVVQEALKMKKCVIVGISGVTNGGKTTLCEQLERDLPMATHINMDDYFYDAASGHIPFIEELNHGNYEDPRAINFGQMEKDVDAWVTQAAQKAEKAGNGQVPPLLFLEGILIFNYMPLVPYYSLKYFLTLSKEECWERRKYRRYDPPDPPNYFDLVVWPMYLKNRAYLNNQKDIVFLDGMDNREATYKRVLADLKVKLEEY